MKYRSQEERNLMIDQAMCFALQAHEGRGQDRKDDGSPYVFHPIAVARLLAQAQCEPAVVAAGLLHDVVEDAGVSFEEIEGIFGSEVATVVSLVTEDKEKSWFARKRHIIQMIRSWPPQAVWVKLADKIDSLECTRRQIVEVGRQKTWSLFKQGGEWQYWYAEGMRREVTGRPGFLGPDLPQRYLLGRFEEAMCGVWGWKCGVHRYHWERLDRKAQETIALENPGV